MESNKKPIEVKTLEAYWEEYKKEVLSPSMDEQSFGNAKRIFYAGATSFLAGITADPRVIRYYVAEVRNHIEGDF